MRMVPDIIEDRNEGLGCIRGVEVCDVENVFVSRVSGRLDHSLSRVSQRAHLVLRTVADIAPELHLLATRADCPAAIEAGVIEVAAELRLDRVEVVPAHTLPLQKKNGV